MAKKLGRNGNGEGSVYNTIQKAKKKFDNTKMCPICLECKDRSFCSNRTNWEKCSKCKECTICLKKGVCDRFYCYDRYPAQITLDDGSRTTVSNASNRTASIERKKEVEAQIQTKTYVKKNGITILEVIKKIGSNKFDAGKIKKNTKDKDQYHYAHIEGWEAFNKPVQKVTYQDIQDFLNSIRYLSQRRNRKNKR